MVGKSVICLIFVVLSVSIFAPFSVYGQTYTPDGFAYIRGGTFIMGSPPDEIGRDDDENQHQETLSSFLMGKCEVTQAEYEAVMGENPSRFKGQNLPVENISWYDAIEYCNRRSQREGLTPAYTIGERRLVRKDGDEVTWNRGSTGYRLPTEAEWEYACRAGTTTLVWSGNDLTSLAGKENVCDQTAKEKYPNWKFLNIHDGYAETAPVGSFMPNSWGLYDMLGNVSEWCWDDPYPNAPPDTPYRSSRGGNWSSFLLRSAERDPSPIRVGNAGQGFRLVRNVQ